MTVVTSYYYDSTTDFPVADSNLSMTEWPAFACSQDLCIGDTIDAAAY